MGSVAQRLFLPSPPFSRPHALNALPSARNSWPVSLDHRVSRRPTSSSRALQQALRRLVVRRVRLPRPEAHRRPASARPAPWLVLAACSSADGGSSRRRTLSIAGSQQAFSRGRLAHGRPAVPLGQPGSLSRVMPLINGQKMACEPCIRGHRSTKCMHADERLMVPVRKPGRPLSSCPHPSSRACSCAAVTAAIPRKQKCRCGTSAQPVSSDAGPDSKTAEAGTVESPSPPKAANNAAFRVQKQAPKTGPSRKQSVDLAGLGRMNVDQVNILPPYNGTQRVSPAPNGHMAPPLSDMSVYAGLGLASPEAPFSPDSALFPVFPYSMQSPVMPPPAPKPAANGHASCAPNGSMATTVASTSGACCGGSTSSSLQAKAEAPEAPAIPSAAVNETRELEADAFRPFLADSRVHNSPDASLSANAVGPQTSAVILPPFQPPMAVANGMYAYYPQPTIFSYPPQYGSFLQPLQPEQWRQVMATMSVAHAMAPPADFGMMPSTPLDASGLTSNTTWTSHQCSCGDSCQCIGCAAHPYNEATQNYVRSAWNIVMEGVTPRADGEGVTTNLINGTTNGCHERAASLPTNDATTPVTSQTEGLTSPGAPHTPSDGTSSHGEEQSLSANDFFFVSYSFADSCAGDTASCPCGDDCQCIGCVLHSNPGPTDSMHHGAGST